MKNIRMFSKLNFEAINLLWKANPNEKKGENYKSKKYIEKS